MSDDVARVLQAGILGTKHALPCGCVYYTTKLEEILWLEEPAHRCARHPRTWFVGSVQVGDREG